MRVPRIYLEQEFHPQSQLQLPEQIAHRLGRVLRLAPGHPLVLFNGRGGEWHAQLHSIDREQASVLITKFHAISRESPLHTELGLVLARGKRSDWALQKAVELGLDSFYPLFSDYCELRPGKHNGHANRVHHWQQIAIHASEQSGRTAVPRVHPPLPLQEWLQREHPPCRLIMDPQASGGLPAEPAQAVSLLSGPEGGFSAEERKAAHSAAFHPVSLGPRILRSETAPAAILSILQYLWGREISTR